MIDPVYFWEVTLLLAAGTFAIRSSVILLSSKIKISERLREIFSFIPAAVLPALVGPMVYYHEGVVDWVAGKERLVIIFAATVISYYSKNMLATIAFGLGSLYLITHI